jgi:hypothetical protein
MEDKDRSPDARHTSFPLLIFIHVNLAPMWYDMNDMHMR